MATRRQIYITFQDAMRQADHLQECAESVQNMQRRLQELKGQIQSGWEGEASRQYLVKCEELSRKLLNTSNDLSRISSVVRRAARSYYEAEQRALEAVKNDSSGG